MICGEGNTLFAPAFTHDTFRCRVWGITVNALRNQQQEKDQECWIALIRTVITRHTGDLVTPLTKTIAQQLG